MWRYVATLDVFKYLRIQGKQLRQIWFFFILSRFLTTPWYLGSLLDPSCKLQHIGKFKKAFNQHWITIEKSRGITFFFWTHFVFFFLQDGLNTSLALVINTDNAVPWWPEVLTVKHESRIPGQWSDPVAGSRKSQASYPWAKQHCAIMENHIQGRVRWMSKNPILVL